MCDARAELVVSGIWFESETIQKSTVVDRKQFSSQRTFSARSVEKLHQQQGFTTNNEILNFPRKFEKQKICDFPLRHLPNINSVIAWFF